ncbi:adenosine kinase [Pelagovum pacificum]|uniref:Adenosine kinase n=1 Tax=Pelagovum pacificum TaxID=2588711 RepID=A0A5C5GHP0_9RHOB|nr:adenosine kinase [Pelagovum pacificum]QQA43452.1 adenosine kinase [Pelagovum pacificum]TNY33411.1 adenosine kinase [Pelagovum pacificum]
MKKFKVVGIGNAIVDVLCQTPDGTLSELGIEKGIMQLIERDRAESLYGEMAERVQAPGGSVANTMAGLGALGLKTGFIGRVRDDALGRFYAESFTSQGSEFVNAPVPEGELPTSRCMIFVTPDGERSMNTYLGISSEVGPDDVSDDVAGEAEILFLEGYLYDKPKGKEAFDRAAKVCRDAGGRAGISLSDPFCCDRHRPDFQRLVTQLDYVIGNEHEWEALYDTNLDSALDRAAKECRLVVCTRSGKDVVLIRGEERVTVPVERITPVDATGAGDQFAAGFLYGLSMDLPLETCGRMGVIAGREVIGHMGPRPEQDVMALFNEAGLV